MKKYSENLYKNILKIALPVTLHALLQASFSVVDQLMIGHLGGQSIAAIGLAGKFISIYTVLLGAIATTAGIMLSQYLGQKNEENINKSFYMNLLYSLILGIIFTGVCIFWGKEIIYIYNKDVDIIANAVDYLKIFSIALLPMALGGIIAVMLRCMEETVYPLIAGIVGIVLNTGLNYLLISGNLGFPALGVKGASLASVISQIVWLIILSAYLIKGLKKHGIRLKIDLGFDKKMRKLYVSIIAPVVICEFLWSLGENVYGGVYGNMGTESLVAMTLTFSIQALMIGALSGLSQASGIIVGRLLGQGEYDEAYSVSKTIMKMGFAGSILLSALLVLLGRYYTGLYNVSDETRQTAYMILIVFAIVSPVKVQNMILGGGIVRSGGKTKYIMWVDIIGTWLFGVPLAFLSAFVLKISIPYVYFILSLEEVIRLIITLVIFKKKGWMHKLE
ncbi:MAG: MATE family efflux transporter [Catonella sp.]|uniref:MATE family efflux transporter n=1 Tax=Catonella sp. TaxID=2382125 RepID=UPI003FA0BF76